MLRETHNTIAVNRGKIDNSNLGNQALDVFALL